MAIRWTLTVPGLLCVTVLLVAGCGGPTVQLSAARVQRVFASHGMHPARIVDTRTATAAQIERVVGWSSDPSPAMRKAQRPALHRLVAMRRAHPLTFLLYKSAVVVVWGKVADAESFAQQEAQTTAEAAALVRAQGGQPAGTQVKRIGNTVLILPATPPSRMQAAITDLANAK